MAILQRWVDVRNRHLVSDQCPIAISGSHWRLGWCSPASPLRCEHHRLQSCCSTSLWCSRSHGGGSVELPCLADPSGRDCSQAPAVPRASRATRECVHLGCIHDWPSCGHSPTYANRATIERRENDPPEQVIQVERFSRRVGVDRARLPVDSRSEADATPTAPPTAE
jgi:hypothetical protein